MPRHLILPSLSILSTSVALYVCRLEYHRDSGDGGNTTPTTTIQVVSHRGASALRPERALASYRKAIDGGADIIEPDLVSTKDSVPVARHENEISGTTNVVDVITFAGHKTTKTIDGQGVTGWFTEDFTPGELKTLCARERIPNIRLDNVAYNNQFDISALDGVTALAQGQSAKLSRDIGIYPEAEYPTYFQSIGLPLEDQLIDDLRRDAFTAGRTMVYVQSFEVANLKAIRSEIGGSQPNWKLVQLMGTSSRQPCGFMVAKDSRTFSDVMASQGVHDIVAYANGVGPDKSSIMGLDTNDRLTDPAGLIRNARNAGLMVHPYMFSPEDTFPPPSLHNGANNTRNVNGPITEIQAFLHAGVDGLLTNNPTVGRQAVSAFKR